MFMEGLLAFSSRRVAMCWRVSLCLLLSACFVPVRASADTIDSVVFISAGLTYDDGRPPKNLGTGTGFLISKDGFVVTAKHVIPNEVPAGATLVLKGTLRSTDGITRTLIPAQTIPLGVDITLLRFDPNAQPKWEYLKVSSRTVSDTKLGDIVVAWGFALNGGINRVETRVSSLVGPENTVQVGPGLVRGMSGGPVLNAGGNVVGVITGGAAGEPALTYYTPISFANPLIRDVADYMDDRPASAPTRSPREPIARNYDVVESRTIGALQNKEFSIKREAEPGRTITNVRFVTTTVSGVSDINLSVAPDRKSVTLKYVVNGGQTGSGTLIGSILTEQQ
jgi:S1-C subfamily serine protease